MKNIAKWIVGGIFIAMALAIVFVKAGKGQKNGQSGGTQTAEILQAAGGGATSFARALEGG